MGRRLGGGGALGGGSKNPRIFRGGWEGKENNFHTVAFRRLPCVPSVASPFGRSSILLDWRARACTLQKRSVHVLEKRQKFEYFFVDIYAYDVIDVH